MDTGRTIVWLLALVASIVQLITVSWPIAARLGVFVAVLVAGAVWFVYLLSGRRAQQVGAATTVTWLDADLVGQRFVKIPESQHVAFCELRSNRELEEQWIPLGAAETSGTGKRWPGSWWQDRSGLHIHVGRFRLDLTATRDGTWVGRERGPDGSTRFLGVFVDPSVPAENEEWTGVKIGEHGVRRVFHAHADGRFVERDPFGRDPRREGRWRISSNGLLIEVDEWALMVDLWEPWQRGVYLGSEHSTAPEQRFAVVRVRTAPP